MKKNKIILKHCPNFYKIINFDYLEDDNITLKLIKIYKNYIFNIDINDSEDIERIEKLDYVLNKYLEDYYFRKEMNSKLLSFKVNKESNIMKTIVQGIIDAFESYEMGYTRNIYFARWI